MDIKNHDTLATNLVSYWDLEEASGTRYDLVGSNDLSDNNTVTQAAGKSFGNGADFEKDNSEYLDVSDPWDYQGSADFTYSMWVKPETISASWMQLWYHWGADNVSGTQCIINSTKLTLYVGNNSTWANWQGTISGGFSAGTWYHIVCQFDGSQQKMRIYVDGVDASSGWQSATHSNFPTSPYDPNASLAIGATTSGGSPFDGLIDEFGFWDKVLSTDEIADLYNSGDGLPYYAPADIKNDTDLTTSLVSYWELEEDTTADRVDSHGSNDLTASESIARATGVRNDGDFAADFEAGDAEYLSIADTASLSITGDIAMSAWVKYESLTDGGSQMIISKYADGVRSYGFQFRRDGGDYKIRAFFSDNGSGADLMQVILSTTPVVDTWYHVVCNYDASAGDLEVFIDGVSDGIDTSGTELSLADTTATFAIGANEIDDTPTQFFDGKIDEVGLYSKLLPIDQVRALYGYGTPPVYEAAAGGGFTPTPMLHMLQASGGLM